MRVRPLLLVSILLLACPGCVAVVAGGAAAYGVVKYERNSVQRDFDEDIERTWVATLKAMRELGYPVAGDAPRSFTEGKIEVRDTEVRVVRLAGDVTRVIVRIGTFETMDHQRRASLILEAVGENLWETR